MHLKLQSEVFQEVRMGDQVLSSKTERHTVGMTVKERNAKGLLRLRVSADGLDFADVYIDHKNDLQDMSLLFTQISSDDAEVLEQMVMRLVRDPILGQLQHRTLALNARTEADLPFVDMFGPFLKPTAGPVPPLRVSIWYAGHRVINGKRAAEVRVTFSLRRGGVDVRFRGQSEVVTVNSLAAEGVVYLDVTNQFGLAQYLTVSMGLRVNNRSVTAKTISASRLDLQASKGI
jgi:hypothetical protein